MIRLGLLELGGAVLADHHEGRQEGSWSGSDIADSSALAGRLMIPCDLLRQPFAVPAGSISFPGT
jgi:hypothetical protein